MMAPFKDIRVILSLIFTGFLAVGIYLGVQEVLEWKAGYDQNQERANSAAASSAILQDGAEADEDRDKIDRGLASASTKFNEDMREAKHEPEIAVRADRPVPQRVRDAFRKRRLLREQLGCAGIECRERSEATHPP